VTSKNALRMAKDLVLPDECVTEVMAFLGRRGSGKTYGASKFAEQLYERSAQFIVIDTVGTWWGLRLAANGVDKGLEIPVLGGLHGDIPLEHTAGTLIADLVVDRQLSVVLDVSQWESDADKARFAADFGRRFFHRKRSNPSAVNVILEECQEIVPQNPQREEIQMLHVWTRTAKLGRNYGIGLSLLSQRPQEVNKKVLNLAEVLFAFQLAGTHERKAVEAWIESKDIDEDISGELPKLKVGEPHVWSPALLGISKVVAIDKKWTFDASRTPKLGEKAREVKPLAPIDLTKLQKEMAATIEKAKAEDPTALRKRITELERQAKAKVPAAAVVKEKPVRDEAAIERAVQQAVGERDRHWRGHVASLTKARETMRGVLKRTTSAFARALEELRSIEAEPEVAVVVPPHISTAVATSRVAPMPDPARGVMPVRGKAVLPKSKAPRAEDNGSGVNRSQQRVLNALALIESLGTPSSRRACGFFAAYRRGGRFNDVVSSLKTRGLLDYPSDGFLALTDEGRSLADASAAGIDSIADLHGIWQGLLNNSQWRVLSPLLASYPKPLTREELQAESDYQEGGRFNDVVSSLKTLGAVEYPSKGSVRASDVLFPEGLT
jgi:hypothetical protein